MLHDAKVKLLRSCPVHLYVQAYANFTIRIRSITTQQIAAELPGLHS